ncbi:MAG: hypothetical protein R2777_04825 [Chitinophagales bacterium]
MKKLLVVLIAIFAVNPTMDKLTRRKKNLAMLKIFFKSWNLNSKGILDVGTIKKAEIKVIHYTDLISSKRLVLFDLNM